MSTTHTDAAPDSTAQEEKPATAGFSSRKEGPVEAAAGKPSADEILAQIGMLPSAAKSDALAGFSSAAPAEPLVAGSPVAEAREPLPYLADLDFNLGTLDLYNELSNAWGETEIDAASYEAVKHFTIVQGASAEASLIVADPRSNDEMRVGTRASDGVQAVLGNTDITAAQALSRAQMAMTSTRFRTEGVEEVHGTEKDKALLVLAAQQVGLVIINMPEINPAVMAQALLEWAALSTEAAPTPDVQADLSQSESVTLVEPEQFVEAVNVTELPADGIPVLTDIVSPEELAAMNLTPLTVQETAIALKDENYISPEAREILAAKNISEEDYLSIRKKVEAGESPLVRSNGSISLGRLSQIFHQSAYDGETIRATLESLRADNVVDAGPAGSYKVRAPQPAPALA